jgi:glycosyltransferase involved in cell wall biosynthesis
MKNIVIVSHKFLTQPSDSLVSFLNKNKYPNVLQIYHSFSDASDRKSYYLWYKDGVLYKKDNTKDFNKKPELLIYFKEFFYTAKWIFLAKNTWNSYIGLDGLCSSWGILFRKFKKVKKVIYWVIDIVPKERFKEKYKNYFYHLINKISCKSSNEVWDLSPRMIAARKKYLNFSEKDYKAHRVVPYGCFLDQIKKYDYSDIEKHTIVFLGHLLKKQGVQLVLQAIPYIVNIIPDFRFKIIGAGDYAEELLSLAKSLDIDNYCFFMGKIEDYQTLENEVAKCVLGVAPYIRSLDTWTYYADPGKIKTYMACGLPVILTDVSWNAREIENEKCGLIITEDPEDIAQKIIFMLEDKCNIIFRNNVLSYSKSFDYNVIFNNLSF